jgi:hypothetical protein
MRITRDASGQKESFPFAELSDWVGDPKKNGSRCGREKIGLRHGSPSARFYTLRPA